MNPQLPFFGRIGDQETADRSAWPRLVKGAPKLGPTWTNYGYTAADRRIPALPVRMGYQDDQGRADLTKPLRPITLTPMEKEWLGVDVVVDGAVWQVWSLHPTPKTVWLVRDGSFMPEQIDALKRVER